MPGESEYGHRIRELERQVTILEQQVKQNAAFIAEMRSETQSTQKAALTGRGAAIASLLAIILDIVLHATGLGKAP